MPKSRAKQRQRRVRFQGSARFLKDYRRASAPLQGLAVQEVQLMQRRAVSLPRWAASYDRVAGVGAETVIELELGSGPRLLAHVGGDVVTLVAMGGHNVVGHYARRRSVGVDLARVRPLPPEFSVGHRDPFFPLPNQQAPRRLERWWPEVSPDWLYFLDTEQARACEEIITSIEDTMLRPRGECPQARGRLNTRVERSHPNDGSQRRARRVAKPSPQR